MFELFIIVICVAVIGGVAAGISNAQKKTALEKWLANISGFHTDELLVGELGESGIAVDRKRKAICLVSKSQGNVESQIIQYRDILSAEISEDGVSVTATNRTSQAGGLLLGGLALGGVGAVIGGLSGKKTTSEKISSIDLNIVVNRPESPVHSIRVMYVESAKNGAVYRDRIKKAKHWLSLVDVFVRQADDDDRRDESNLKAQSQMNSLSVTDELTKLSALKNNGVISDDEFKVLKSTIIAGNDYDKLSPVEVISTEEALPESAAPNVAVFPEMVKMPVRDKVFYGIGLWVLGLVVYSFVAPEGESSASLERDASTQSGSPSEKKQELSEEQRQKKIAELLMQVKALPVEPYGPNLRIYKSLASLDPANTIFSEKMRFYQKKVTQQRAKSAKDEEVRSLMQSSGLFAAAGLLKNPNSISLRNVEMYGSGIVCGEVSGKNDFGQMTAYERFVAGGEMAFAESQVEDMGEIWAMFCK